MSRLDDLCGTENVTINAVRLPSEREGKTGFLRFHVTLTYQGRTIETPYSMGQGHIKVPASVALNDRSVDGAAYVQKVLADPGRHNGPLPTAADVLHSLISDASCYEDSSDLEDFAANFGGEIKSMADAKKIERSYMECGETAKKLKRFLGERLADFQDAASDH